MHCSLRRDICSFFESPVVLRVKNSALFFLHPVFLLLHYHENLGVNLLLFFFVLFVKLSHHLFEGLKTSVLTHVFLVYNN